MFPFPALLLVGLRVSFNLGEKWDFFAERKERKLGSRIEKREREQREKKNGKKRERRKRFGGRERTERKNQLDLGSLPSRCSDRLVPGYTSDYCDLRTERKKRPAKDRDHSEKKRPEVESA